MQIGAPTCHANTPLVEIAKLITESERDVLAVMGDGEVIGVISQSDLVSALLEDYEKMTADDIMTHGFYSVSPEATLREAVEFMKQKGVHQLFVIKGLPGESAPMGVLSKRHIVEMMAEEEI
jgi:predicted transcriptional regulator